MDHEDMGEDLATVLLTEEQIQTRLSELADWLRANNRSRFLFTGPPLRLPASWRRRSLSTGNFP